jgi:ABC-2 type transport system permease protein
MSALIRSELLKLRTARSFIVLTSLGLGLGILIGVLSAALADYSHLGPGDATPVVDAIANASVILFFLLMLGVLSITNEFRHGSIAATLLVEPDRRRLLAAKVIAASAVGALIGLLTAGLSLVIYAAILPGRGSSLDTDAKQVIELLAGMAAAGALMTALGVGVGALVRKQTPAIVGVLVYLFLLEPIVTGVVLKSSQVRFALSAAIAEVTGTSASAGVNGLDKALGQVPGGLVLLGWTVLFIVLGGAMLQARDVTD